MINQIKNMIENFTPTGDYVLVLDNTTEDKSTSKIILTNSVERGDTVMTKALDVGPGIYTQNGKSIPMNVTKGDIVLYRKDIGGTKIKFDGIDYILFHEHELLMIKGQ